MASNCLPCRRRQCASMDFNHIWGRIEAVYYGFSSDEGSQEAGIKWWLIDGNSVLSS